MNERQEELKANFAKWVEDKLEKQQNQRKNRIKIHHQKVRARARLKQNEKSIAIGSQNPSMLTDEVTSPEQALKQLDELLTVNSGDVKRLEEASLLEDDLTFLLFLSLYYYELFAQRDNMHIVNQLTEIIKALISQGAKLNEPLVDIPHFFEAKNNGAGLGLFPLKFLMKFFERSERNDRSLVVFFLKNGANFDKECLEIFIKNLDRFKAGPNGIKTEQERQCFEVFLFLWELAKEDLVDVWYSSHKIFSPFFMFQQVTTLDDPAVINSLKILLDCYKFSEKHCTVKLQFSSFIKLISKLFSAKALETGELSGFAKLLCFHPNSREIWALEDVGNEKSTAEGHLDDELDITSALTKGIIAQANAHLCIDFNQDEEALPNIIHNLTYLVCIAFYHEIPIVYDHITASASEVDSNIDEAFGLTAKINAITALLSIGTLEGYQNIYGDTPEGQRVIEILKQAENLRPAAIKSAASLNPDESSQVKSPGALSLFGAGVVEEVRKQSEEMLNSSHAKTSGSEAQEEEDRSSLTPSSS